MSSGSKNNQQVKQRNSKSNSNLSTNNNANSNNNNNNNKKDLKRNKSNKNLKLESSSSSGTTTTTESTSKTTTVNNLSHSQLVKEEMAKYVLWRRPFQTIYYFLFELIEIIVYYFFKLLTYRKLVFSSILISCLVTAGFYVNGAHLPILLYLRKKALWCAYWIGLGVASSIGLGTGLHTFLLYLGPFIGQVTLAAYECNSLNFPEPPFPDDIICPSTTNKTVHVDSAAQGAENMSSTIAMAVASSVSILSIMSKVRLESFMWGAGTAIGELPPYFMARASALSSMDNRKKDSNLEKDEELEEFEHLLEAEKDGSIKLNFLDKLRLSVFKIIKRVGFWGILLCASIPNPLFDLAGITCGHFLVRFWTFFGATLIGKAIIKMHIQKMFVIFLFSQHHLDNLFQLLSKVPLIGEKLQPLFQEWLTAEKTKLHRIKSSNGGSQTINASNSQGSSESILSWLLNKIVLIMIVFFIVSIVNSLAQQRYKRLYSNHLPIDEKKKVAND